MLPVVEEPTERPYESRWVVVVFPNISVRPVVEVPTLYCANVDTAVIMQTASAAKNLFIVFKFLMLLIGCLYPLCTKQYKG